MTELELTTDASVTAGLLPVFAAASSNAAGQAPERMPASVPREQLYYWTYRWQEGIRQSRAELDAGEYRDFANPRDAIRWLLSEEGQ
jgi:hypothetical protein